MTTTWTLEPTRERWEFDDSTMRELPGFRAISARSIEFDEINHGVIPKPINEDMLICLISCALSGAYESPRPPADPRRVHELAEDIIKEARKF